MPLPDESPTGRPLIPPALVPWLTAVGALAVALEQVLPPHTVAAKAAHAVVAVAALLGLVSPGWRR